ncbi:MAG: PQQ-binding-like beta-propeller repeat protein, partial [bacterium]|nr:PQQ-binding-like beta-propeller repeat protein [bacterium]
MIIRKIRTAAWLCMVALGMGSGVAIAGPGELLWKYETEGQIWSSATAVNGTLYFGSDDGQLYALRSSDAKLEWRFATGGLVRFKPAVTESHVYFCSDDGFLYFVNRRNGSEH